MDRILPSLSYSLFGFLALCGSCSSVEDEGPGFLNDAAFIKEHAGGEIVISGTGAFLYSAQLQGRVMTSSVDMTGPGLGFVHHDLIAQEPAAAPFHNYGGEERLWIGPEGSRYSLYFEPGDPMQREVWRVPNDLDQGAFRETAFGRMERDMNLTNVAGTTFQMKVERALSAPTLEQVEALVGQMPENTQWTGFDSVNTVTNRGTEAWTRTGGLPNIWLLGMFLPGERTMAILPFRQDAEDPDGGPAVRGDYFGSLDERRLRLGDGFALFRADAEYTSKVGVLRNRAREVFGAYDPDRGILTVIRFGPIEPTAPYLDERWVLDADPFYGDVVNSYNHGGPEPFYELESSSPGLELAPGGSHTHRSLTLHLRFADDADLAAAVRTAFGLEWDQVRALAGWD